MKLQNTNLKPGQKQVIIIGGGFAGLAAAKELAHHEEVQVILIDQKNHHLFQPLLYQVATAGLNPSDIAVPIRAQFARSPNVSVHLGRVDQINLKEKWISGEESSGVQIGFDYLIIACGAQHSYFGKEEWEEYAPGLKTLEQATEIRRRILSAFELAENEFDPEIQKSLLTFVIVGGGPTGVELAGAIADISRTVLVKDFKRINPASARVILVEAGPRVLASFAENLSQKSAQALTQLGVEVRLNSRVEKIDLSSVSLIGGEKIITSNVFWAAGVQAEKLSRTLDVQRDRAGRIHVSSDLSIPQYPYAFAVGDVAHVELGNGNVLPGLAPAAIQTGKLAAKNILATIRNKNRKNFRYLDKGQMATIGKHKAIAQVGKFKISGYIAWFAWLFIHILYLIDFRNRISVLFEWGWSYLFSKRGSRLITRRDWKLYPDNKS